MGPHPPTAAVTAPCAQTSPPPLTWRGREKVLTAGAGAGAAGRRAEAFQERPPGSRESGARPEASKRRGERGPAACAHRQVLEPGGDRGAGVPPGRLRPEPAAASPLASPFYDLFNEHYLEGEATGQGQTPRFTAAPRDAGKSWGGAQPPFSTHLSSLLSLTSQPAPQGSASRTFLLTRDRQVLLVQEGLEEQL